MIDFAKLQDPFPAHQVSWRVQRAGQKDGGGIWARVIPYVDTRYIYQRLDDVCTPAGWRTEQKVEADVLLVGLSLMIDGDWVTKWDGTGWKEPSEGAQGLSAEDASKATFTIGFRRVAAMWGIARYPYFVHELPAKRTYTDPQAGRFYAKLPKGGPAFSWDPPDLQPWALPGGQGVPGPDERQERGEPPKSAGKRQKKPRGQDAPIRCLECGGPCYDNRTDKPGNRRGADIVCKNRSGCGWKVTVEDWERELLDEIAKRQKNGLKPENAAQAVAAVSSKDLDRMRSVAVWLGGS